MNAQLIAAGRIRGRVTDQNGSPIASVLVRSTFDMPEKTYSCMDAYTDTNGFYELGVPDATHYLGFFTALLFGPGPALPYAYHAPEYYNNVNSQAAAAPIEIRDRAVVSEIDAHLDPAGAILGRVTDRNGVGLLQIRAVAYHDPDGNGLWEPFRWA